LVTSCDCNCPWKTHLDSKYERPHQSPFDQAQGAVVSLDRHFILAPADSRTANAQGGRASGCFGLVLLPVLLFRFLRHRTLRRSQLPLFQPLVIRPLFDTKTPTKEILNHIRSRQIVSAKFSKECVNRKFITPVPRTPVRPPLPFHREPSKTWPDRCIYKCTQWISCH
jgi:hypothetical protein